MNYKLTDVVTLGNAIVKELHKSFNGGTLVMVVTESRVDDRVSTSVTWVPDAADKTPTV